MSTGDLKLVEEIYRLLRKWENEFPRSPDLQNLQKKIIILSQASALEIKKLGELSHHFKSDIDLRQLTNLIIPFERALNKSLRDDEFIISEVDTVQKKSETYPLILILENFRSAFNVGSFFRMAEALGAQEIWLCGYSPTPENDKIKKTTMNTEQWIPWRFFENTENAILEAKAKGFRVVGIETSPKALPITYPFSRNSMAFVFGNERFGLHLPTLQACDELRKINLTGQKNSLNVASCGAIVCYEWIRQWTSIK